MLASMAESRRTKMKIKRIFISERFPCIIQGKFVSLQPKGCENGLRLSNAPSLHVKV